MAQDHLQPTSATTQSNTQNPTTSLGTTQQNANRGNTALPDPSLAFRSIMPLVDDLIDIIYSQGVSDSPPASIEASEQVAAKAKALGSALQDMRKEALKLPGGDLRVEQIEEMTRILEDEAEKRRTLLRSFGERPMPMLDGIADEVKQARREGSSSVLPTPATGQ